MSPPSNVEYLDEVACLFATALDWGSSPPKTISSLTLMGVSACPSGAQHRTPAGMMNGTALSVDKREVVGM